MGFLDALAGTEGLSVVSSSGHRRHRSRSRARHHKKHRDSRSRSRSSSRGRHASGNMKSISQIFGFGDSGGDRHHHHSSSHKHNSSRASFFGLGGNGSRSSFFGTSRSSYYKRQPRQNFMHRAWKQLKKIIRNLVHYAKRHPWKVFFLVIMPLVTGGALTALLARFGLRMPSSLDRMIGMASRAASGDHFGLVNDAVRLAGDFGGSSSHGAGGSDLLGSLGGLGGVAKMFS